MKLEAGTEKKGPRAPSAEAIAPDTRMPLARQFDNAEALERLEEPSRRDRMRFAHAPGPVGFFARIRRDAGPRLLFVAALVSAAAGAYIAFG